MDTCAIVGDSIAVGVGAHLRGCIVDAAIGISAAQVIGRVRAAAALIVSAGANNPRDPDLASQLEAIRARARGRVIWIAPVDPMAARAVAAVAARHGDAVIHIEPGPDRVHPRSYPALADAVRSAMAGL